MPSMFLPLNSKILFFCMVGIVGFVIDGFLLTVLTVKLGVNVLPSRGLSFVSATLVTWLLNRVITFSRQSSRDPSTRKKEYILYLSVQAVGAALNFMVFLVLIDWCSALKQTPVIPLAGGAVVALVFNFVMSGKFVYMNQRD